MKVHSIFRSIDGEVNCWGQGVISTFIRLCWCNLECAYCDTEYARDPNTGFHCSPEEAAEKIKEFNTKKVTITGGEPYMQEEEVKELVKLLRDKFISIETNGSFRPTITACHIMDYKLPSSKMIGHMNYDNFIYLGFDEYVKFVVMDKHDFAIATHTRVDLKDRGCVARFAFSPVHGVLDPVTLFNWMQEEGLYDAVLNVQLHKLLNLP